MKRHYNFILLKILIIGPEGWWYDGYGILYEFTSKNIFVKSISYCNSRLKLYLLSVDNVNKI